DNNDDTRVEEEHPTAGKVIRMDQSLHLRWRTIFGEDTKSSDGDVEMGEPDSPSPSNPLPSNIYAPFASEINWCIAQWVVKDGIRHNSFDRLLKIPGV
ncbi:hypothetical protein BDZ89DRAFT_918642, partial [Hymenopellis radicata]